MRRPVVVALAACLAAGALIGPADAKKPKRKPAPTFTESGSLVLGHPGTIVEGSSVTRTAFVRSCAVPPSQGTDGYVITLPAEMTAGPAEVSVSGGDLLGAHDLDLAFYDESCAPTGELTSDAADEFGLMPADTKFVVVTAFFGVEVTFDFKATATRW